MIRSYSLTGEQPLKRLRVSIIKSEKALARIGKAPFPAGVLSREMAGDYPVTTLGIKLFAFIRKDKF
jgi:hypothetical protein